MRSSPLELLRIPVDEFKKFEFYLRTFFHNNLHNLIGGTMATDDAAGAPEFFLHHAMIDKIWADWQSQSDKHKKAFFLNRKGTVLEATTNFKPGEFIDLNKQPGEVKVKYEETTNATIVKNFLRGKI